MRQTIQGDQCGATSRRLSGGKTVWPARKDGHASVTGHLIGKVDAVAPVEWAVFCFPTASIFAPVTGEVAPAYTAPHAQKHARL